jgi:hypothetical protein
MHASKHICLNCKEAIKGPRFDTTDGFLCNACYLL